MRIEFISDIQIGCNIVFVFLFQCVSGAQLLFILAIIKMICLLIFWTKKKLTCIDNSFLVQLMYHVKHKRIERILYGSLRGYCIKKAYGMVQQG